MFGFASNNLRLTSGKDQIIRLVTQDFVSLRILISDIEFLIQYSCPAYRSLCSTIQTKKRHLHAEEHENASTQLMDIRTWRCTQ